MHTFTAQDCLSPNLDIVLDRPVAELVSRTNTSITVNWTAPTLASSCTNVFFPPLMYMVRVALDMINVVDGFPQVSTTCTCTVDFCTVKGSSLAFTMIRR